VEPNQSRPDLPTEGIRAGSEGGGPVPKDLTKNNNRRGQYIYSGGGGHQNASGNKRGESILAIREEGEGGDDEIP